MACALLLVGKSSSKPPNHRKTLGLASASDARVGKSQVARPTREVGWCGVFGEPVQTDSPDLGTLARPGMACARWLAGRLVSPPSAVRLIRPGCRMAAWLACAGWLPGWLAGADTPTERHTTSEFPSHVAIPRRRPIERDFDPTCELGAARFVALVRTVHQVAHPPFDL